VVGSASPDQSLRHIAEVAALLCHATAPHYTHQLRLRMDDLAIPLADEREFRFECVDNQCREKPERVSVFRVPAWLAGAVALMHHTGHEGHRFDTWVDGKLIVKGST
jgi:hypothetical protein